MNVFNEKDVEHIANKLLSSIKDKIKSEIADDFYHEMQSYLYEHYDNFKCSLEQKLINQITENFSQNPNDNKYSELRKRIYKENTDKINESIIKSLTKSNLQIVLMEYLDDEYHFNWQWKDALANFVVDNWELLKSSERFDKQLSRRLEQLQTTINNLKQKMEDEHLEICEMVERRS